MSTHVGDLARRRPRLTRVAVGRYLLALLAALVLYYAVLPFLPWEAVRPGSALGQSLGIVAGLLFLAAAAFSPAKRIRGLLHYPPIWMDAHILVGGLAALLAFVHAAGRVTRAPGWILLAIVGLLLLGIYGRLVALRLHYRGFATPAAFQPASPDAAAALSTLVAQKRALVAQLAPAAAEGTFSLSPAHWLRHPALAWRFQLLAWVEERQVYQRRGLEGGLALWLRRNWRLVHMSFALLTLLGIAAHVVVTLFFADYAAAAAGEPDVYWWHFRR
ncbi:MAG: hypothetical protein HY691_03110 [Chloroflexi bacterium]|nr:hypothetical protein [Chloroflexota bacterium]